MQVRRRVLARLMVGMAVAATLHAEPSAQRTVECERCNLRFDLAATRASYEVGEPISLSITITNAGSEPFELQRTSDVTGRHDGYRFEVVDKRGDRIADPGLAAVSLLHSLGSFLQLAPRAADSRQLILNYQVAPLKPGRYTVKAWFNSRTPERVLSAESNSVSITIVPTSTLQLQQRIAASIRSIDRDPISGAALLAFTGDRSAIPPLTDLLYQRDDRARAGAIDALLYFDRAVVTQALVEALNRRGPRERMIEFLIGSPDAPVAQIKPLLLDALRSENADARGAAVKGLTLLNVLNHPHDQEIFAPLAAMLADPVASVRHQAAIAVGGYADERALRALRSVVADADPTVSEQATIAVGWVAQAANPGSATRNDAIAVLRAVAISARGPASDQALTWLGKVDAR